MTVKTTPQPNIVRYEVTELESDRHMARRRAQRLSERGPDPDRIRTKIGEALDGKDGIVATLLRSPLIGAELDLARDRELPRDIDL